MAMIGASPAEDSIGARSRSSGRVAPAETRRLPASLAPPPPGRTVLIDLNALVAPYLGAIVARPRVSSCSLLVIVLSRRVATARLAAPARRCHAGGGRPQPRGDPRRPPRPGAGGRPRARRAVGAIGRPRAGARRRSSAIGLVRFNPFEDTGGNQSFALALLDRNGDGFVVSSLHARAGTRVYAKAVAAGKSEAALSDEEAEALRLALASADGIAARPGLGLTARDTSWHGRDASHGLERQSPQLHRDPVDRTRPRGSRSPLEQIPVWDGLVPDAPPSSTGDPPAGLGRAARAGSTRSSARRHARRRAAARRRGRGHRQDPGHHAPDRLADRDQAGAAVGDPRPDVHGQGRGRDAGPGRPARPVRLHGHRDLDVPRLRRPAHPRVRVRARPAAGRAGPVARRRPWSSCASTCSSSSWTSTARWATRRASSARSRRCSSLQGRGRLAGGLPRARGRAWRRGAPTPAERRTPTPRRSRPRIEDAARAELARAYGALPGAAGGERRIDFGDQVSLALRLLRESPAARERAPARASGTCSSTSSRTRTGPRRSSSRCSPSAHRNVTVVGDDDQSIYKFRGAAISNILEFRERYRERAGRRPAPQLPVAAARSSTRPTGSSGTTTRTGSRSGRASSSGCVAGAGGPSRRAAVRHEAFATGAEEADWIAAEIARRMPRAARAARPRDPRPRRTRPRTRSCAVAQPRGRPVAVLGHARPVRPPGGPAPAVVPARGRGPVVERRRVRARRVGPVRRSAARTWSRSSTRRGAGTGACATCSRSWAGSRGSCGSRPETRAAAARLVADLRRLRRARPAAAGRRGAVRVPARTRAGSRGSPRRQTVAAEEALSNIARFFDIVRAQSALLADDRAVFFARHLQTLIEAGDDPPTADIDPDADAVAVHDGPQGEGPRVPGRVPARASWPGGSRRRPGASRWRCRWSSSNEMLPEGDYQLQEERRLFYVGMTRARDELVLTHAADYGGQRAPARVAVRARGAGPAGRGRGCRARAPVAVAARAPRRLRARRSRRRPPPAAP